MPGTAGSFLAALPLLYAVQVPQAVLVVLLGAGLFTIASVLLARMAKSLPGSKDPGWFVMDEAAGMWLACTTAISLGLWGVLLAFVLFRVFDIWKPWPIRRLESIGGGFGIVLDDLMAGVYAGSLIAAVTSYIH